MDNEEEIYSLDEKVLVSSVYMHAINDQIFLGSDILGKGRRAAITAVQTLFARHLGEEVAALAGCTLTLMMPGQIIAEAGRCLLLASARGSSASNTVTGYEGHELNCSNLSRVHFFGILLLKHCFHDVQTQGTGRWNAEIMIQCEVFAFP